MKIPKKETKRKLSPVSGKSQMGYEHKWKEGGQTFRVRIHDPDPSVVPTLANPNPNALAGWVVRIAQGKKYMDPDGQYHAASEVNPKSPEFDEFTANETHMPIIPPTDYP